jgi:hypothetical protein
MPRDQCSILAATAEEDLVITSKETLDEEETYSDMRIIIKVINLLPYLLLSLI